MDIILNVAIFEGIVFGVGFASWWLIKHDPKVESRRPNSGPPVVVQWVFVVCFFLMLGGVAVPSFVYRWDCDFIEQSKNAQFEVLVYKQCFSDNDMINALSFNGKTKKAQTSCKNQILESFRNTDIYKIDTLEIKPFCK